METAKYVRWLEVREYGEGNELLDVTVFDAWGRIDALMKQDYARQMGRKAIVIRCETTDEVR